MSILQILQNIPDLGLFMGILGVITTTLGLKRDLQANYFISGAAGDQAEKSIRRCGRLKALIPSPTKLSQKGAEGEKVECD